MRIRNAAQRRALFAGIADLPGTGYDTVIADFERGYRHKPHIATLMLMYAMRNRGVRQGRRPLPGTVQAA